MEDRNYGTIRIKLDEMIEKQTSVRTNWLTAPKCKGPNSTSFVKER